jgi:hypothetical protein
MYAGPGALLRRLLLPPRLLVKAHGALLLLLLLLLAGYAFITATAKLPIARTMPALCWLLSSSCAVECQSRSSAPAKTAAPLTPA